MGHISGLFFSTAVFFRLFCAYLTFTPYRPEHFGQQNLHTAAPRAATCRLFDVKSTQLVFCTTLFVDYEHKKYNYP